MGDKNKGSVCSVRCGGVGRVAAAGEEERRRRLLLVEPWQLLARRCRCSLCRDSLCNAAQYLLAHPLFLPVFGFVFAFVFASVFVSLAAMCDSLCNAAHEKYPTLLAHTTPAQLTQYLYLNLYLYLNKFFPSVFYLLSDDYCLLACYTAKQPPSPPRQRVVAVVGVSLLRRCYLLNFCFDFSPLCLCSQLCPQIVVGVSSAACFHGATCSISDLAFLHCVCVLYYFLTP